jgi:hypothetical protein
VLLILVFQIVVAALTEAALIALSMGAASRLKAHAQLPMQWQLDGTVTKTAPRRFALAFTPILTVFVLAAMVALSASTEPRPGQGWMLIPATVFVCLTVLGAHAFHLWMMSRLLKS